jgi:hypothetical protein
MTGSINQRVLPRARNLAKLGLQPGKPLPANLPSYAVHSLDSNALIDGEAAEVAEEDRSQRLLAE